MFEVDNGLTPPTILDCVKTLLADAEDQVVSIRDLPDIKSIAKSLALILADQYLY